MKCYVAGPMRGIPEGNFPAFDSLSAYMRSHGWTVYSPADNDREAGLTGADAEATGTKKANADFKALMRLDLWQVCDADAVVLLPGWENSKGASLEKHVAEQVGTEVLYAYPHPSGEWFVSEVYIDGQEPEQAPTLTIPVQGVC